MNYGWRFMTLYRRQGSRPSPWKRNAKNPQGKGEKERNKRMNAEFQKIVRRDKEAFLSNQCKEIEENNRMGKTRHHFKKIRDTKGTFQAKMGT